MTRTKATNRMLVRGNVKQNIQNTPSVNRMEFIFNGGASETVRFVFKGPYNFRALFKLHTY